MNSDMLKGKRLEWFHRGLCWHYMRSILWLFLVWTLDCSPSTIPAVVTVFWDPLSCLTVSEISCLFFYFYFFSYIMGDWIFGRKWNQTSPKSAKNPSASVSLGLSVLLFYYFPLREGFFFFFFSWGNAIQDWPSVWHESIDIFVYAFYNITVNDWWIYRTYFLFCYISYIHKYIYIKMFTIRFLIFNFFFWVIKWMKSYKSRNVAGVCQCYLLVV